MNLRYVIMMLLFVLVSAPVSAQVTMSGNIETHVDSLVDAMPTGAAADTNKYQVPSATALAAWGHCIEQIASGNYSAAQDTAATFSYRIVKFTHTSSSPNVVYYLLEKTAAGTNYWGMFAYNPSPKRGKLFIQSPHPLYDSNTGQQGIMIFHNNGARAFYVSGTHRCNSTTNTTCDGTTDVCGGDYKMSDQAHVVNGPLHQATVTMSTVISQMIVIQNHGFGKDTGDPDVIMGNGKTTAPTGTDYLDLVRDNLSSIDPTLVFKLAHVDTDWTTLTGTTNTQGRFINGSVNPCGTSPSSANGRFLHIEQALTGLRNSSTNRKKLSDAIAATFTADALNITSPNGGETTTAGSTQSITWTSSGLISSVKLEYTVNNGTTWITITSGTTNDGSYSWTVPNTGSWRTKIRISDAENSSVGDTSNAVFKISYAVYPTTGTSSFVDPASAFGPRKLNGVYDFHRGIDFAGTYNTPIRPARAGIVVRKEDSAVTSGGSLQRFGTWMLVRIDSSAGQSRFNAYLHLNGFHRFNVGDTVSTSDTIAFMGKSGYEINTVHLHFELYKNLSGTSIDKDKANNPMEILPYTNSNSYTVSFTVRNDSSAIEFTAPESELDLDQVTIYGSLATRSVGYNSRTSIDPANNDNPNYAQVMIDPDQFIQDSTMQRTRIWTKDSETGAIDSVRLTDVNGYSFSVGQSTLGIRYAVTSGNWNSSIWAASPGGAAGSASVPTSLNNIVVNAGITVTVNSATADCRSISFGSTASKLSLNIGSALNVYGDITLFDATHTAVSTMGANSKLIFKGSATQVMHQWSTSAFSTSFNYIKVDKNGGKVTTDGTNMRFGIGDTLEILNGTFEVATTDDIESRNAAGSATSFTLIVRSGGTFNLAGGASHIRRASNNTLEAKRIGKAVIYGNATMRSTSSNGLNFNGIDVESGGRLILASFSNSSTENFNPGTVIIKSGGEAEVQSTAPFWESTTGSVNLQQGGRYIVYADPTNAFPSFSFTNNGKVIYNGTSAQTVKDMNYSSLSIAAEGVKSWTPGTARTVTDTLEITDGTLMLASTNQTVSVQNVLRLNDTIITGSNTLSLGTSVSNRGTLSSGSGIIVGKFQRWFTTAVTDSTLFPVGTSTKFRPAAVSFSASPSTGGTLTVQFTDAQPGSAGLPLNDAGTSIVNVSDDGYWTVTAANGLTGGTFSAALSASGLSGISDRSTLRIIKRQTAGNWTLNGTHAVGVGTNSAPTVRRSGMNGFSEFAIGSSTDNPMPVELVEFSATAKDLSVILRWGTATESGNVSFEIQRTRNEQWSTIGSVNGHGTSQDAHQYGFTDKLNAGGIYHYRLKQTDVNGSVEYSSEISVIVGAVPRELKLYPNYPNPFNPSTTIQFTVPKDVIARLSVFNDLGQRVAELFNGQAIAGTMQQVIFDASSLPSGLYFIRLNAGPSIRTSKMILLK
ncbi:MAG: peptidoglycan DD-metalloendopeptidase family protein [Bacteroidota bacterium]